MNVIVRYLVSNGHKILDHTLTGPWESWKLMHCVGVLSVLTSECSSLTETLVCSIGNRGCSSVCGDSDE